MLKNEREIMGIERSKGIEKSNYQVMKMKEWWRRVRADFQKARHECLNN